MKRICLVESSNDLRTEVERVLGGSFAILFVRTVREAESFLDREKFDLILLDVDLPDGSGFELCSRIRSRPENGATPVVFLTARSNLVDKLLGFSSGADDYICKPFEAAEFRARVHARLRDKGEANEKAVFGPLKFDRLKQRVYVLDASGERDAQLTPFEFRLLYLLASRKGQILSRAEIFRCILDPSAAVNEEVIYTHVSSIRKKLEEHAYCLECLPRTGYRFREDREHPPAFNISK